MNGPSPALNPPPATTQPLLILQPSRLLEFDIQRSEPSFSTLMLSNPTVHAVAYKIKTTSPDCFLVKPCSGLIRPKSEAAIRLQLNQRSPAELSQCPRIPDAKEDQLLLNPKDKFLILSCLLAPNSPPPSTHDEIWKNIEKSQENNIKLNVIFRISGPNNQGFIDEILNLKQIKSSSSNNYTNPPKNEFYTRTLEHIAPDDLKKKYKELVDYTLALEKQIATLQVEKERLTHTEKHTEYSRNNIGNQNGVEVAFKYFFSKPVAFLIGGFILFLFIKNLLRQLLMY